MSDNLESYFRKHLKDETPGPDQWNVPSDNVWGKIQPEISKRKGVFIPWKYFYIFGIGLILLISTLFLLPENADVLVVNNNVVETVSDNSDQIKTNENELDATREKELTDDEANISGMESSNPPVAPNKTEADVIPILETPKSKTSSEADNLSQQEAIVEVNEVSSNPSVESVQGENTTKSAVVSVIVSNEALSGSNVDNNSTNLITDEIISQADEEILESDVFVYSSTIDQFNEVQGYSNLKGYDYLNSQKANPIPYTPGKFGIGAYYAPTYTSIEVSGLELPGNDQMGNTFLFSNNWGFDFYYYLSYRFTIVSGVGSSEIRSWSKTTSQFNYDSSTEHDMGDNQTANGTEQSSPTPFGALSSEVVYSFSSDTNIPDGELMESVSETFQNIRYLSIPLGIEYNLLKQEKSLWFL